MKSLVLALVALPFLAGVAGAAQPLNDNQMDAVSAGFSSLADAFASGLAGESGIVYTATDTATQVKGIGIGFNPTFAEGVTFLYQSTSAAQSATVTATFSPASISLQ
jgi:hypothetical protein